MPIHEGKAPKTAGFADNEDELATDPRSAEPTAGELAVELPPLEETELIREINALVAGIYEGDLRVQGNFSGELNALLSERLGVPLSGGGFDMSRYRIGKSTYNEFGDFNMNTALRSVAPPRSPYDRGWLRLSLVRDDKTGVCYLKMEREAMSLDGARSVLEFKAAISTAIGERMGALLAAAEQKYPGDPTMARSIVCSIFERTMSRVGIGEKNASLTPIDEEKIAFGHNIQPSEDIGMQQTRILDEFDKWHRATQAASR